MYQRGDWVTIVAGEYAGLSGVIVQVLPASVYEVSVDGYRLPVAHADLAPDLHTAATNALTELRRVQADPQLITQLALALNATNSTSNRNLGGV